ncbi:hypothetical protein FRB97_003987 [Tulasnella sp. 331]|nr:hypothetical protein FRB97_003987 [Tulasnella sp. 331]
MASHSPVNSFTLLTSSGSFNFAAMIIDGINDSYDEEEEGNHTAGPPSRWKSDAGRLPTIHERSRQKRIGEVTAYMSQRHVIHKSTQTMKLRDTGVDREKEGL